MMKNSILLLSLLVAPCTVLAEQTVRGFYVNGFEKNHFKPCGLEQRWWVTGGAYSKVKFALKNEASDWRTSLPVYVEMQGVKSEQGHWGHLDRYRYEFRVTRVLKASLGGECEILGSS